MRDPEKYDPRMPGTPKFNAPREPCARCFKHPASCQCRDPVRSYAEVAAFALLRPNAGDLLGRSEAESAAFTLREKWKRLKELRGTSETDRPAAPRANGLSRGPFKPEDRVRAPAGSPVARVAQMAEHAPRKGKVAGSTPASGSIFRGGER